MPRFRRRQAIEAFQVPACSDAHGIEALRAWARRVGAIQWALDEHGVWLPAGFGDAECAAPGDWIVQDEFGTFFACAAAYFAECYEPAEPAEQETT